ncbi:MAG: hypothetical protein AAFQ32_02450 [Pseudomonadota bacterium]
MKCVSELSETCRRPTLTEKNKKPERTLLSVFLRALELVPQLRSDFLQMCDYGAGRTCNYASYMETTYPAGKYPDSRPDGLLTCQRGKNSWSAFVEAKANDSKIRPEQIQDYASLAAKLDVDAVISISNEFARVPTELPFHIPANKQKKRVFFHFAWAELRGLIEQLSNDPSLSDMERGVLSDVVAFFWEKASGITTFDLMPKEWPDFVRSSGVGVGFSARTPGITEIIKGWQQERRDLRNKLAHSLGVQVDLRHEIGVRAEFSDILNADRKRLADEYELTSRYFFKELSVTMDLLAELQDRKISATVDVPIPENKGARALTTWIAKATQDFDANKTFVVFTWKGKNNENALSLTSLRADPDRLNEGRKEAPKSVRIVRQIHEVKRFSSRKSFILDAEALCINLASEMKSVGIIA